MAGAVVLRQQQLVVVVVGGEGGICVNYTSDSRVVNIQNEATRARFPLGVIKWGWERVEKGPIEVIKLTLGGIDARNRVIAKGRA